MSRLIRRSRTPLRLWMTGCLAIVMAALGSPALGADGTVADAGEDRERRQQALVSPYGVDETLTKIEAAARSHGLTVFARVAPSRSADAALVLGSSDGVTPVMADAHGQALALPLALRVGSDAEGRTRVSFMAASLPPQAEAWSAEAERVLAPLPELLRSALS